jgi:hypothetical protein
MQNWQLAAEALFSGLMMSNVPNFSDELNWLKSKGHSSIEGTLTNASTGVGDSVLAVAIKAVNQEEKGDVFMWEQFLNRVWNAPGSLRTRVSQLDEFVAKYLIDDDSARFLFDICYTQWLSEEGAQGELSDAWLSDEEMISDRGSELLTVLMYIQEVNASGLEADLNDFVDAFLTDEDFDLQDDLGVFDVLIQQAPNLNLAYVPLIQESKAASVDTPLEGLLPGIMCFFKDPADPMQGIGPIFSARLLDQQVLPIYMCLITALKEKWCFPEHTRPNALQRTFFGANQADSSNA